MNKTTLKDRLRIAMQGPPVVTAADLARAMGISRASVSELLSGQTKRMKEENLKKAARKLNVNIAWLGFNEGPMRGAQPPEEREEFVGPPLAMPTLDNRLPPAWIAEVHRSLRQHAAKSGKRFDIESPEGSDDFSFWLAIRSTVRDASALDVVIELQSRRTQQGVSDSGHGGSSVSDGAHGRKR